MNRANLVWLMAFAVATTNLAGQDLQSELLGTIEVDGSSTVAPISTAAADMFLSEFVKVKIPIGVSGTGGGLKRFTKGDTDISNASRPIKDTELAECRKNDIEFYELPIAYDGLTIAVNKKNTWVKQLTVQQLSQIFSSTSAARTWDQIDPSWPRKKILVFSPGTDSGTFDYFKEVVVGPAGSIRPDMSVSEDDNNLVQAISNTENSIGFFGVAYYFDNVARLNAVPIVNSAGQAVLPTSETIRNGTYNPFSRPLFIYVNAKSARRPEVRLFAKYFLERAAEIAEEAGYVGLPDAIYEQALQRLSGKLTGTHYWDADGRPRHGSILDIYVAAHLNR